MSVDYGGRFGNWISRDDIVAGAAYRAFRLLPLEIQSSDANLVLPRGGVGEIWHLLGGGLLVCTAHVCGDITVYYPPRTLLKLTGLGLQSRELWIGDRRFLLDMPVRCEFGEGFCEWKYDVELSDSETVSVIRRAEHDNHARLRITVRFENARPGMRYVESWEIRPEPLVTIPLMGSGPVPSADADTKTKVFRTLAYAASGIVREAGALLRSAGRFQFHLQANSDKLGGVVVGPARQDGIAGIPGRRPVREQEPTPYEVRFPELRFTFSSKLSGAPEDGLEDAGSRPEIHSSGGRGFAEVRLVVDVDKESEAAYSISVPEAGPAPGSADRSVSLRTVPEELGDFHDELLWHADYLRRLAIYDDYFQRRFVTQGSAYTFLQGAHGAPRDYAISVAALAGIDPLLARSTLDVMLMMTRPSGSMYYMHTGKGWCTDAVVHKRPSDLPIFLLWAISEYAEATGDTLFLRERIPFYPLHEGVDSTIQDRIVLAFRWIKDRLGVGPHGMLRVGSGDWADPISLMVEDAGAFHRHGESGLNTAFAAYALGRAARLIRTVDSAAADEMEGFAAELSEAMEASWTGEWYLRGWDGRGRPLGESHLFVDAQAFALIAEIGSPKRRRELLERIWARCVEPSPIGALIIDRPHPVRHGIIPEGWDCNGGVWAAVNAFLAWGAALLDVERAIECLRKQMLAAHAAAYPNIWYGIWSGPDCYNAFYAEKPGETFNLPATPMSEYPVMNSNAHAGPLLAAQKISRALSGSL